MSRLKVLPVLRKLGGKATVGEVVAGTGLTAPEATETLWTLVSELDGHVDVGAGGDVLFRFPPSLQKQTKSEAWANFWGALYAGFKTFFKVGIMVILGAYFLVFAIIAVLMVVATLAKAFGDSDSNEGWGSSERHGSSGFDLGDLFGWLWLTDNSRTNYQPYDRWQRSRGMSTHAPTPAAKSLPLYQKVVGYVFGDEEPPPDPSRPDRETLAYVRDKGGYLTATDVLQLRGTRGTESAQIASRLAFTNGGFVEITDHGTVLFRFEEIMSRLDRGRSNEAYSFCWEDPEPELQMNSNSSFFNFCVTAINAFNLLFAGWFALSPEALGFVSSTIGINLTGFQLVLGGVPFLFSTMFFVIPALRSIYVSNENARRGKRNRWRELLQRLSEGHIRPKSAPPVTAQLLQARPEEVKEMALAYDAREDSPGAYVFDRLRQEWQEVQAARKGVAHMKWRFGGKVFSTDDPAGRLKTEPSPSRAVEDDEGPRRQSVRA